MSTAALYMAHALKLAEQGRYSTQPNPRVGCVVVKDGKIIGEGFHARAGEPHAEVLALRHAGTAARGADVYVTLEPCTHHGRTPPCANGLIAAGVNRVWVAMQDPNPLVAGRGLSLLRGAGIEVQLGLLGSEAAALNRGFISRMVRKRPFVTVKIAASLDGRTAMASGESKWITNEAARADVHRLRAEAGAVLTSSATVLADDPELNVRILPGYDLANAPNVLRQPDRIVLDSRSRIPHSARIFAPGVRRMLLTSPEGLFAQSLTTLASQHNIEVLAVASDDTGPISLPQALAVLAAHEVNHVLVEAGPVLSGAFLQAGLVDELVLYLSPTLMGHEARALAHLPGLSKLKDRLQLRYTHSCMVGDDLRITATPTLT